jgi:hypothetical protein
VDTACTRPLTSRRAGWREPGGEAQAAICDYLAAKRLFFWRQNDIPLFSDGRFRALPKHRMKGIPDIIVLKAGRLHRHRNESAERKLSPEQAEFSRLCVMNGGDHIVAPSIDDVQKAAL